MRVWWADDTARVAAELAAIRGITEEGWFRLTDFGLDEWRFSARGVITAHGIEYPVVLIYPDQFPSVPVWVQPQDTKAKWSAHQYGEGGVLCLELRPDNWTPTATGADVLRSAFNLLSAENPLGEGSKGDVPSAHYVGQVQRYGWDGEPFFLTEGCLRRISAGTAEHIHAMRWGNGSSRIPVFVHDSAEREQGYRPPSPDRLIGCVDVPVFVVRKDSLSDEFSSRVDLLNELDLDPGVVLDDQPAVILVMTTSGLRAFSTWSSGAVYDRPVYVLPDEAGHRSGRSVVASGKSVAIVGAGSVGSKVLETILRSGARKLFLVDGDVMLPANLERHVLDWSAIGFKKVEALRQHLLRIFPGAVIRTAPVNLNWQRSAKAHADTFDSLAECDVIVDATGDVPTGLMLGALAAQNGKAFVSVSVFEGGLGFLVFRSVAGFDPEYVQVRAAYLEYCEAKNVEPPPSGARAYESLAPDGTPVIADDASVTAAAAYAGRTILDVLDGEQTTPQ